jgi:hypothetical protein
MTAVIDWVPLVSKSSEIRASVPIETKRLIKAIAGLKNSGKDWTLSDCVNEALQEWLEKPENQDLIKRHNLQDRV